jgi:pimeloyl-ACP methyl ester carboxylesterase
MKNVYFLSGLGADKRVFSFLDLSFCKPVFIDWLKPVKNESLKSYALRLRKEIPERDPVIVGISFGGMLASEIAKADENAKAIIISSNKTHKEFPGYFRIGKYLPLYKWIPGNSKSKMIKPVNLFLGAKGKEQKQLLKQIITESDPLFVKWAIGAILHWDSKETAPNIIHIHGTRDRLLPYRYVKADYTIQKGGHVMTMDNHAEISAILKKLIQ